MKWLCLLFRPCRHHWKIIDLQRTFENSIDELPISQKYVLQCNHCGDIKTRKI
jgi:hypothetical protein